MAPSYVTKPLTTPNSETLTYYADGQIATETFSDGSNYSYQYDNNGNLIREEDTTVDGNNNTVHTVTQTTYDSHNRITGVTETNEVTGATMLQETFSYDAAGNRREVKATSNGSTQDAWYTYDQDNRVEITDGSLQNSQIVVTSNTGSYENAYDADGNVIKVFTRSSNGDLMAQTQRYNVLNQLFETDYAVDVTQGATNNGVQQTITYDADGHALVTQNYYELGATITVQNNSADNPPDAGGPNTSTVDVGGELQSATVNFYDAVGRMAESQTFNTPSGWDGTSTTPTGTPSPDATTYGSLTLQSEVVYQGPNGSTGYDADGDVVAYQYRDSTGRVDQYQVTYFKKDTYLQADTTGDSNVTNVQPATDQSVYDTRGNQVALEQHTEDPYGNIADTVRVFAYNGNGEIIESQNGTGSGGTSINLGSNPQAAIANYTYVNGQQLASFNNDGSNLNVLDQVTAFSSNNDSPNSYVVKSGDTLESIAQMEYGNANLWYVIAQANDLSSDTNLVLGQRLQIPAVTTHSNSATTFKPYDPSGIIGSTTPNLPTIAPPPPPAGSGGCSVAQILVLVVTIVVTVVTWGSTSALLVGELGEFAGDVAAGALAGAAGSLAGQIVGNATGIENGINWGGVLEGAIGGAIGGGITSGLVNSGVASLTDASTFNGLSALGDAVVGATTYVGEDVAAQLTGQPEHFSWVGLVGSTIGAAVGGEISEAIPVSGPISSAIARTATYAVGDVVNREADVALGDRHVPSWAQLGEQIVASGIAYGALGAASAISAYQAQQAQIQQSNEQLGNQVAKQVGIEQSALNDTIWNAASAQGSAELQSAAQVALNESPQGIDVPNVVNANQGSLMTVSGAASQTTTYGSDGSVTVTASIADGGQFSQVNSTTQPYSSYYAGTLRSAYPSGFYWAQPENTPPASENVVSGHQVVGYGSMKGIKPLTSGPLPAQPDDAATFWNDKSNVQPMILPDGTRLWQYTDANGATQTVQFVSTGNNPSGNAVSSPSGNLPPINVQSDTSQVPVTFTAAPLVDPEFVSIPPVSTPVSGNSEGANPSPSYPLPNLPAPAATSPSPRYTAANAPGSVSDTLGLSPEAMDASIQAGNTGAGAAAWYATKATFYEVWNFASAGFLKRNDARQAQWLNGQLSDSNYYKGMAIDAAGSVATVWVGGQAGGVVLGKVGGGIVGHVISGAAAGGAGDAVTQTQQRLTYVATQGQTGQKQYSGEEFVTATAAGAVLGGAGRAAGDVTINVGRDGVTLRTPNSTYGVRSPLYLDSSPGQLNSGMPVGVRSPLVKVGGDVPGTEGIGSAAKSAAANRAAGTTRLGVTRTNAADWRSLRDHWDDLGYGEILSPANRALIAKGATPVVDDAWIAVFPEDAGLAGEKISMHHIAGSPITVPLPATRHLDAHMPGGFRYNPGGPGSWAPFYPPSGE